VSSDPAALGDTAGRRVWRPGLGATIGVTLAAMIVLTAAAVVTVSYRASRDAMVSFSSAQIHQNARLVREQVEEFLGPTRSAAELSLRLVERGLVDARDLGAVEALFFDVLTVHVTVSTLSFGNERGEFVMVKRRPDGALWTKRIEGEGAARRVVWRRRAPGAGLAAVAHEVEDPRDTYDPRARPWYTGAVRSGGLHWTDVYVFHTDRVPGVTAGLPYAGPGGGLRGVISVDVSLVDLSRFVGRMRVGDSGRAFVLDRQHRIVAWPEVGALTVREPEAGPEDAGRLLHVSECASAPVREIAQRPELLAEVRAGGDGIRGRRYRAGGQHWLAALEPIAIDPQQTWLVGVIALEDELLREARSARLKSGLLALGLAGLALLVGVAIARVVARSLTVLARESERLRRLDLTGETPTSSRFREVHEVLEAFDGMKVGLRAFEKYVPVDLVRTLVEQHTDPVLGGESRELTIFFSDIRDFTTLSESTPPDVLARLLGDYLAAVTDRIEAAGGTVDKYIGDAVMAFWGAPRPVDMHAHAACRAALQVQAAIDALGAGDPDAPDLYTRIGIHTARVIVGNFGSESRLNYTAMGDGVNLASRLEGLNKLFGTRLLVSGDTWARVRDGFEGRYLGRVAVKGRREAVRVHEVLGCRGEADPARVARARRYEEAMEAYAARRWYEAQKGFGALHEEDPGDRASREMLSRCRVLRKRAPGDDWTDAITMTTK
jgi:adenylate cyclase